MDARAQRGLLIAAKCKIVKRDGAWVVPSQSNCDDKYTVRIDADSARCSCPDHETRQVKCKHIFAVEYVIQREEHADGSATVTETVRVTETVERKTYKQNWPAYNAAQTTEKHWFLALLGDLCRTVPQPERKPTRGQRPVQIADAVFGACFKVYSGLSARRFTCDLEDAAEAGHVGNAVHFNSVLNALDNEAMTPVLSDLVARSAAPLRDIETEFAVDSSGFSGSKFTRWFDEKYGVPRQEVSWVKAHVCCGTRTNVIAAAEVVHKDTNDSPYLPPLVMAAAKLFNVKEVAADKAYPCHANFNAVDAVGGVLYTPFRSNMTGRTGGLFEKAFHYFNLHRDEFLTHYHRRSMVEATFSMVKRKFGDSVRARTDTAMRNEVMAKFVCHNVCCVVSAIYERGLDPAAIGLPAINDGGKRAAVQKASCTP
jgi:transposase